MIAAATKHAHALIEEMGLSLALQVADHNALHMKRSKQAEYWQYVAQTLRELAAERAAKTVAGS